MTYVIILREICASGTNRFVRELSDEDVAAVEAEAERKSLLGELHADEFNPHGQAYVQAEQA